MSDTEVKKEDPVTEDRDDGGDDEVRDGLSVATSDMLCVKWHQDGRSLARL